MLNMLETIFFRTNNGYEVEVGMIHHLYEQMLSPEAIGCNPCEDKILTRVTTEE